MPFTFKILVETAFSGKNSTLLASGKYKLDGPIGIADGTVSVPTLTVEKSIIDSIAASRWARAASSPRQASSSWWASAPLPSPRARSRA